MFKLVKERKVKDWPVDVAVPLDGGEVKKFSMTLDFKLVGSDEFRALSQGGDSKLFGEVVTGWSGIQDESGEPLAFTKENLKAACQNQQFTAGALSAYMKVMSGTASTKN
ncbi:hypothetical protein [Photobacterium sanguinicancri]|uniref:hypothetical protein n=1 Tax=Photobacterium sanguinicancri TaxID=875932 RepID=UPI0026E37A75|nr:hypothetical protein [Photobacterium sanguinicancri]MDO6497325.1 hypothetical protein [Photobacterium sanguinicancri]